MHLLLHLFSWFISILPLSWLSYLAHTLATLSFSILRIRRSLLLKNLRIAYPELSPAEHKRIAYLSVYNFILTILEFLHFRDGTIGNQTQIEGMEHIKKALEKGKGAYVICMHLGNWEAMGSAVSKQIAPVRMVLKKIGVPSVNRFVYKLREKNKFHAIQRDKKGDAFRGIQEALKNGNVVGFVMDQAKHGGPRLPFLGTPARTNTSLAAFWRKNPVPILVAYSHRLGVGKHVVHFLPEITLQMTDDAQADILNHSLYFNELLAPHIARHKEQYFWLHDRWKN